MFNRNIELRNLPASSLSNIAHILDINKDWQEVVTLIPKNIQSPHFERKYNCEEIQNMEKHALKTNRPYAEVLFDEWGTSGRVRPTLGFLKTILEQAQIFRAADEVARMIGEPPSARPKEGPGAVIATSLTDILNDESVEQILESMDTIPSSDLHDSSRDNALCNGTTIQMKEPSDLIKFTDLTNGDKIKINTSKPQEVSDMLKFSVSQSVPVASNSDYVPDITGLLANSVPINSQVSSIPETCSTDNTASNTTDSSSENGISHFIPVHLHNLSSASNCDIFDKIDRAILDDKKLNKFQYIDLETVTGKFTETLAIKGGGLVGKIGSGGFGDVYVGSHKDFGPLAVKKVRYVHLLGLDRETVMKIFNTEVKSLSYLRHKNIVPILGYSIDGPTPCLVCEYIDGGSLLQKIADKVLSEQQRLDILRGTAEGLKYIHHRERPLQTDEDNSDSLPPKKSYYLHGDVKSANILLTKDCVPKLCDFGLAKQLDSTIITRLMMGTSAYMAPEGFSGNITQKNDIFSFGIVMLETLTGLKPIVSTRGESMNIKQYIEDNCPDGDIAPLLDRAVSKWTEPKKVYDLANKCLEQDRKLRPSIDGVCDTLNDINI